MLHWQTTLLGRPNDNHPRLDDQVLGPLSGISGSDHVNCVACSAYSVSLQTAPPTCRHGALMSATSHAAHTRGGTEQMKPTVPFCCRRSRSLRPQRTYIPYLPEKQVCFEDPYHLSTVRISTCIRTKPSSLITLPGNMLCIPRLHMGLTVVTHGPVRTHGAASKLAWHGLGYGPLG